MRRFIPAAAGLIALVAAGPAQAQSTDTTPPVLGTAAVTPVGPTQYGTGTAGTTPVFGTGIGSWFVNSDGAKASLSATDNVGVAKLQYSLDNGATWIDLPITAGPSVSAVATITQEGNTTVRYRALDAAGNVSVGATPAPASTTLNAASAVGATAVRLQSTNSRAAGDVLTIDAGANQETATIASLITPAPAAPAPNVNLTSALTKAHASGVAIVAQAPTPSYRTVAVPIDTVRPEVSYPTVSNNRIGHSAYVTPTRTDPAPSSGAPAIREAWLDGKAVTPQALDVSKLSLGKHTFAVTANDTAGNSTKATLTFAVTTSYADVDALVGRYTTPNATTLGAAAAVGATTIRLANPRGRIKGDTLVLGTGAGAETVTIAAVAVPETTAANNVTLTAPLTKAQDSGTAVAATSASAPAMSAATGASLREKLAAAKAADEAGEEPTAIGHLEAFVSQARASVAAGTIQNLLVTDAQELIRQARGLPEPSYTGLGLTAENGTRTNQHLLILPQSSTLSGTKMYPSAAKTGYNPNARFKVLVMSNRSDGFRHESIQTYERMIQQLGRDNNFDVDLFDYVYPDESIPNPFYSAANLAKYKVIVGVSSVGNNQFTTNRVLTGADAAAAGLPDGTVVDEQKAFQDYVRAGGGFAGLHGASDSMHNWDWYKELIAGEFQNHGNNVGSQQPQCPSCNITEVVVEDKTHPSTSHFEKTFLHRDELYNFRSPPREKAHPLLTLTDATFSAGFNDGVAPGFNDSQAAIGGTPGTNTFNAIPGYGADHPISWCQNFEGGRAWANILTHNWEPAYDPRFQRNILKGIEWAAGATPGNCVTHREVKSLIAAGLSGDAASAATALVDSAYVKYLEKRYGAAVADIDALKAAVPSASLKAKAQELKDWMFVLNGAAIVEAPAGGNGAPSGTVPATLSLSLGSAPSFGAFTPGVARDYFASSTANVISTAGNAALSIADPASTNTGKLVNGSFALAQTLQATANGGTYANVGGSANPTAVLAYNGPVSNDAVSIGFKQSIGASEPLRTGAYSKTLTFTLSTTAP